MSIQYRKHDYFHFQNDKKNIFRTQKNIPNQIGSKSKNRNHVDKTCPDSKSKHLGDRE